MKLLIGIVLIALGGITILASLTLLSSLVYPILWWGIILIADEINLTRWANSLILAHLKQFLYVILPLSTLYWLYFELVNFFGFYAPAGLPDPILKRLNAAAVQAMQMPDLVAKFRGLGFEPSTTSPDQFRQFIRSESAKFSTIIADAGLKLSE